MRHWWMPLALFFGTMILICIGILIGLSVRKTDEPVRESVKESEAEPETVSGMMCEIYVETETEETEVDGSERKEPETTTEAPTEAPAETAAPAAEPASYRTSICGIEFPYADFLYKTLSDYGLESWYEIGLSQCFQESRFNCYAENPNGLDKGLFQYRLPFWKKTARQAGIEVDDASIFDPHIQIAVYCYYVRQRLDAGRTVDEVISDHYTGGYGYSAEYVAQVKQWLN